MNDKKNSGIRFDFVNLVSSHVNMIDSSAGVEYGLAVTSIKRNVVDGKLKVLVSFDLMKDVEKPAFSFTATYSVGYKRDEDARMSWDEFTNGYVLTHVLPYFREFVTSVTLRLPVPPVFIPPTNIDALLKEYKKSISAEP